MPRHKEEATGRFERYVGFKISLKAFARIEKEAQRSGRKISDVMREALYAQFSPS